jgi:signal peptidase II
VTAALAGPGARGWARALAVAGTVVALDQGAKWAVVQSLAPHERVSLVLGFHLDAVANRGVAFGFLGGGGPAVVVVTVAALVLVIAWFAHDPTRPGMWLAVGLLAGGALGNLADRAREGAVTDFLDPPLWPAFNVADVAITVGAAVLVLIALAPAER